MKLRLKLPLFASGLIVVAIAAGLFSIYYLTDAIGVYARIIAVDKANERLSGDIVLEFKTQVQEWKDVLLRGKDPQALEKYWTAFQTREANVDAKTAKLRDSLPGGDTRELVEQFAQAHGQMAQNYRKGFAAYQAANFDPAAGDAAVKGMDREPTRLLRAIQEKIDDGASAAVDEAAQDSRRAVRVGLLLMAASAIAGVAGAIACTRMIVRPVDEVIGLARAVAGGDLTSEIHVHSHDEIGQLVHALKDMQEGLRRVVSNVRSGVDSVGSASAQIAAGNHDLSSRTEQPGQQPAGDRRVDGTAHLDRPAERRQCTPGQRAGEFGQRRGQQGRRRGRPGGDHDGTDRRGQPQDRRDHQCHRRHRLPDQYPRAQRSRRSGARRRAGPRLRSGGQRGAQPGAAQRAGRARDQDA